MNTEEKEKIEGIYREAKRIRILFGISIVILSIIMAILAPIIIHNNFSISDVETSWGVLPTAQIRTPFYPIQKVPTVQVVGTSTNNAIPAENKKTASTTPYAQ